MNLLQKITVESSFLQFGRTHKEKQACVKLSKIRLYTIFFEINQQEGANID